METIKNYLGDDDYEDCNDNESKIEEDCPYTKKEIQTILCRNKQNNSQKDKKLNFITCR